MKNSIISYLVIVLFYAVTSFAQNSSAGKNEFKQDSYPYPGFEHQFNYSPSEWKRFFQDEKLSYQYFYPSDYYNRLNEQDISFFERTQDFMNSPTNFYSNIQHYSTTSTTISNNKKEAWVRHYASGLYPSYDAATAMAIDNWGNIYVTGYSSNFPFGVGYLTIKYDASGNQIWTARYDGGSGANYAWAICIDMSGNVIVTGYSKDSGTDNDYATIKYNSAGVELWVARYNGAGNDYDRPTALAIDNSGNVYVTGNSMGSGTAYDYATVKYNMSGVEQWVARYNGPGNEYDMPTALAIDNSGNVYVTGHSKGSGTAYDYATIKYNMSGAEQWVARYNGPGDGSDEATALAIDNSGNVYVTGSNRDSVTYYDYATVKYNGSGVEQWVARYDGPRNSNDEATAIAVDASDNVYVTGFSLGPGTSYDYATIKYNGSGNELWVSRYNGSENDEDEPTALVVDNSGNVYVTGSSTVSSFSVDYTTVKYNQSGIEEWAVRYDGPDNGYDRVRALCVDNSGNIYVTGLSYGSYQNPDYATIKYNSSGGEQWVARYNGPGNSYDEATALVIDDWGNIYVTGLSRGADASADYATVKYNATGVEQWIARYDGPENDYEWDYDEPTAITVDGSGNIYITGRSYCASSYGDYATVKYSASGIEQWVARYNGPGNGLDVPNDIAVDNVGNVYVTGYSRISSTNYDYATIKYNAAGIEQWIAYYDGPANERDEALALAIDGSNNVYVTGNIIVFKTPYSTNYDYATIKYNSSGDEQWVACYNGPENRDDKAIDIAVDNSGNVYVTGYSSGSNIAWDYATIKYNTLGVEQWVARYNGTGNGSDIATDLAVDGSGNVYVTGQSDGSVRSTDYATVKYNQSGDEQWVARYNWIENSSDEPTALAIDDSGNVYVTGSSHGFGEYYSSYDYVTIKYNETGIEQWVARYNGPGDSNDEPTSIALDNSGNVYVAGTSDITFDCRIFTIIKYDQGQTPVTRDEDKSRPSTYWLSQNYPNPFNPITTISYQLPEACYVTLSIYDITGRLVETLVNENVQPGYYSFEWDASKFSSGVYFYRIQAGEFSATGKCLLLR